MPLTPCKIQPKFRKRAHLRGYKYYTSLNFIEAQMRAEQDRPGVRNLGQSALVTFAAKLVIMAILLWSLAEHNTYNTAQRFISIHSRGGVHKRSKCQLVERKATMILWLEGSAALTVDCLSGHFLRWQKSTAFESCSYLANAKSGLNLVQMLKQEAIAGSILVQEGKQLKPK